MTDVLLVLPLLASPDFSAAGSDTLLNPVGGQDWQYGGEVWVGKGFAKARSTEFCGFAGLGASTMAYTVGDHRFDGTGWTAALEGGPRWTFGDGPVQGFTEIGVGLDLRVGLPDWADGAWAVGLGTHTAAGIDFGRGDVRPRLGILSAIVLAPTTYGGTVQLPEGTLSWSWSPSRIEMAVTAGVVFGKAAGPDSGAAVPSTPPPAGPLAPAAAPPAGPPAPPPEAPPRAPASPPTSPPA